VKRSLTIEEDRLPAISGIARQIQSLTNLTYTAGVWIEDIRSFAWSAYGSAQLTRNYRAPSWSWAAREYSMKEKKTLYPVQITNDEYQTTEENLAQEF
jgi:hypothetical protein